MKIQSLLPRNCLLVDTGGGSGFEKKVNEPIQKSPHVSAGVSGTQESVGQSRSLLSISQVSKIMILCKDNTEEAAAPVEPGQFCPPM
jgi:hypothetical protein